jgi:uncharacterized protein (TIGR02145 family)
MAHAFSLWWARFLWICLFAAAGTLFTGSIWAQAPSKSYRECNHDSLLTILRAYEDSLALAASSPVVRRDYTLRVTDVSVTGKEYRLYRCDALQDSLVVIAVAVDFARATAPAVDTDSISGVNAASATFHAKVTSDGGEAVTAQWFRYGTSAASLVDSAAVTGTATPFTASVSTLSTGTTYYVAGFARNAKGTTPGDTLSFTTWTAPTVDTQAASSVTATAATLNATHTDGGSGVIATGFKYAANSALTGATDVAGSGTTSPFTGVLTGLSANTQYWVVGYATNGVATAYGDTVSFITAAAAPASFTCGSSTIVYDGYTYSTAFIGTECWFAENLRNDNYNNGTAIPGGLNDAAWTSTTSGAQAVYGEGGSTVHAGSGDEVTNLATYGRLYNWHAVNTGMLCPSGWHVPSDAEWTALATDLGSGAGGMLKATAPTWDGTNTSDYTALPGGGRNYRLGYFDLQGSRGFWWTSSADGADAWYRYLDSGVSNVLRNSNSTRFGFSVRCVQD